MAGSKKKKSSRATVKPRAKAAPRKAAPKTSHAKVTRPTKKPSPVKKVAAKRRVTAPDPPRPAPLARPRQPRSFADRIRDCDAGTAVWFITAGSVEHAAIQGRGTDGAVVICTDAGVKEVVSAGNLFETADEARAARYR